MVRLGHQPHGTDGMVFYGQIMPLSLYVIKRQQKEARQVLEGPALAGCELAAQLRASNGAERRNPGSATQRTCLAA